MIKAQFESRIKEKEPRSILVKASHGSLMPSMSRPPSEGLRDTGKLGTSPASPLDHVETSKHQQRP